MTTNDKKYLYAALELLNKAAQEEKNEIFRVIHKKYGYLRDKFRERGAQIKETAEAGKDAVNHAALFVSKTIKKNPWPFIAGTVVVIAVGAFIRNLTRR